MGVRDLKVYTMSSESLFYSPQQCLLTVKIIMEMVTYMYAYISLCVCVCVYDLYIHIFV